MRKHLLPIVLCWALTAFAVNQSYYSSLDGKSGDVLRAALTELLYSKHTTFVSYNWDFPYDYDSNGNMLDIYSSCGYNNHNTYPTSYKCCCDAVNREHVICQSSFGGSTNNGKVPQYSDRHHLYPVDGRANGHRSDLPFGECSGGKHGTCSSKSTIIPSEGTSTCENHEYGRSGASTFSVALPSGGGSVYEVGDEYKGDIARAILYMVVRYADKAHCRLPDGAKNATTTLKTANDYPVTAWANTTRDKVGQMFSSSLSTNYGLSNYGKALLLKWHRQDPVSQKEIDRNDGVETAQGNRNPFVDYPCLVEYLWGEHAGETVSLSSLVGSWEDGFSGDGCSNSASPVIIRPTEAIDLGATSTDVSVTRSIIIQGANLTSGLTLSVGGTNASYFTLSQTTMTKNVATNGKAITITYLPTASGSHNATLRISGGGLAATHEVALTGSCCEQYDVTLYRNGQPEVISCCGTYILPAANTEADACDGWTFRGWSTNASVNTTTTPSFVTQVNSTATLYAVYGLTEGSGDNTEYTLYSGSLVEGDYLIYYSGKVMKAKVESGRLRYNEVTPVNNVITNTDDSIIWHIAQSGDYWTIYNAKTTKYAAGTGADNKAQLNVSGTDSLSLWSASGTSTYEFVNLKNNKNNKNANLRNNGTYGFACYSTSTGGALSLYKRGTATTTYKTSPCPSYTITLTGDDGIMEGGQLFANAATAIAGTTITLEAEPEDGYSFDGWIVTKANDESTTITVTNNQFTMPEYDVLVTGLFSAIPTYIATWMANGNKHSTQTGLYLGDTPDMPTDPDSCSNSRVFVGWTTQADYENDTDEPSDLFTTTAPAITQDTTFYAVYADVSKVPGPGTTTYNRINSTDNLSNGEYLIVYETGNLIFNGGLATLDAVSNTIGVTINNHTIASSTKVDTATFIITAVTGGYSIRSASGLYIGQNGNENGLGTNANSTTYINSISFTEDSVNIYGSKNAYLRYNKTSGQTRFRYYKATSYTGQQAIQLYKKVTTSGASITTYSNYSLHCSEATYNLTFTVSDTTYAERSGHAGETIEAVEAPATCAGYTFVGWSTFEYATNNTEAPTLNYTGRVPEGNTTYHAVFSQSTEGDGMSNNYKRVTQTSELTSGNYVVTGYNNGYFALSTGTKDKYYLAGAEVTPTNDTIKTPAASIIWNISISGDLASLSNAESGNLYIEKSGTYYNIKIGNNTVDNKFTFSVDDGSWTFRSVTYSNKVLEYYKSAGRWAFYGSPDAPIYLYKQQPNSSAVIIYTTAPSCSSTPTDIENTNNTLHVRKILCNGQIRILRGGNVYTLTGQKIKQP